MNKYRQIAMCDGFDRFICLKCKSDFIVEDGHAHYAHCPMCGTKFDGMPVVNKRWQLPCPKDDYELINGQFYCHRPRLIVQYRNLLNRRLYTHSFFTSPCEPTWTEWFLLSHGTPGIFCKDSSMSVLLFKKYKEFQPVLTNVLQAQKRIILQDGSDIRVIKLDTYNGR